MELLPCPFCGLNDLQYINNDTCIMCNKCGSVVLTESWNNRHSPWISTIHNQHPVDKEILLTDGILIVVTSIDEHGGMMINGKWFTMAEWKPTHWMRFSQPPKETE